MALVVENPLANARDDPWVQEGALEKEILRYSYLEKNPIFSHSQTEEPGGLQSLGSQSWT